MIELITSFPTIIAAIISGLVILWGFGASKKKQGREEVHDELQDSYNATTKELHNVKTKRSNDPDAVLDSLRKYAKRGEGGGDS